MNVALYDSAFQPAYLASLNEGQRAAVTEPAGELPWPLVRHRAEQRLCSRSAPTIARIFLELLREHLAEELGLFEELPPDMVVRRWS